jgi:hexosaminidase
MSPANKAYLDMKYNSSTPLGLSWAGFIEVQTAYEWNPGAYLSGIAESSVLGVEAPLWTETIVTSDNVEYMAFPRLPAIAELGWSPWSTHNWTSFRTRLGVHGPRWTLMGINFYPSTQIPWGTPPSPTTSPTSSPTASPTASPTTSPPPGGGIVNGGFETRSLTPWTGAQCSTVTTPVRTGTRALRGATSSSDNAQCQQVVAVQPNRSYQLRAYVNGSYVYLGVTGTGTSDASTWTPGTAGAFSQLSVPFTTGPGTTSVTVYLHGWYGQPTYYADDVTLS